MNTENFIIEESALIKAHEICRVIDRDDIRNRAVANAFAAGIAANYFDDSAYKIDTQSGLHNIGSVLEVLDIADIYLNNSYIDVRIFFNEDELSVPKAHFDHDMLPVAYMFIKVDAELSGANVEGFILPENVDTSENIDGYYKVDEASLLSFYDIEPHILNAEDSYAIEDDQLFDYLDNKIEDKFAFYKKLITSESARTKLIKAEKAQYIFNFVSIADNQQENNLIEVSEIEDLSSDTDDSLNDDIFDNNSDELLLEESDDSVLDVEVPDFEPISTDSELFLEDDNFVDVDDSLNPEIENTDVPTIDLGESTEEFEVDESPSDTDLDSNDIDLNITNEPEETSESSFEYSTVASPSIDAYEDLEGILDDKDEPEDVEDAIQYEPVVDIEENEKPTESVEDDSVQQIDTLFNNETPEEEAVKEEVVQSKKPATNKIFLVAAILVLLGAVGYFGYTKFANSDNNQSTLTEDLPQEIPAQTANEAMPIESINNNNQMNNENEGTSEAIPMIEQNLDASILVSNLKVDWEVPAAYTSNTSAKRYLIKLGKIIQLNLKSELLLLNKPPITNRIAVEIKYNPSSRKFETVGIAASSGEKSVDDIILQTINKALAMNLSINTDSMSKLQGNPMLIIHL